MADPKKPGYKTSEFYVTVAAALIPLINQSGILHFTIPADQVLQAIYALTVYVGSRSFIKAIAAYSSPTVKAPGPGNS